jgi:hypothetical protein
MNQFPSRKHADPTNGASYHCVVDFGQVDFVDLGQIDFVVQFLTPSMGCALCSTTDVWCYDISCVQPESLLPLLAKTTALDDVGNWACT